MKKKYIITSGIEGKFHIRRILNDNLNQTMEPHTEIGTGKFAKLLNQNPYRNRNSFLS